MKIEIALKDPIPNLEGAFIASDPVSPERSRAFGVDSLLDHLPDTIRHCLARSARQSNLELCDVTDTTLDREGFVIRALRNLTFDLLGCPKTKADLRCPAYEYFWEGLEKQGLHPYLALSSRGCGEGAESICCICINVEEARIFLKSRDL